MDFNLAVSPKTVKPPNLIPHQIFWLYSILQGSLSTNIQVVIVQKLPNYLTIISSTTVTSAITSVMMATITPAIKPTSPYVPSLAAIKQYVNTFAYLYITFRVT